MLKLRPDVHPLAYNIGPTKFGFPNNQEFLKKFEYFLLPNGKFGMATKQPLPAGEMRVLYTDLLSLLTAHSNHHRFVTSKEGALYSFQKADVRQAKLELTPQDAHAVNLKEGSSTSLYHLVLNFEFKPKLHYFHPVLAKIPGVFWISREEANGIIDWAERDNSRAYYMMKPSETYAEKNQKPLLSVDFVFDHNGQRVRDGRLVYAVVKDNKLIMRFVEDWQNTGRIAYQENVEAFEYELSQDTCYFEVQKAMDAWLKRVLDATIQAKFYPHTQGAVMSFPKMPLISFADYGAQTALAQRRNSTSSTHSDRSGVGSYRSGMLLLQQSQTPSQVRSIGGASGRSSRKNTGEYSCLPSLGLQEPPAVTASSSMRKPPEYSDLPDIFAATDPATDRPDILAKTDPAYKPEASSTAAPRDEKEKDSTEKASAAKKGKKVRKEREGAAKKNTPKPTNKKGDPKMFTAAEESANDNSSKIEKKDKPDNPGRRSKFGLGGKKK